MGWLSTHVLDTAKGTPAADMALSLWRWEGETRQHLKTVRTNQDGRTDVPLLKEGDFEVGEYEIVFEVGDYFAKGDRTSSIPSNHPFLNLVPLRFGIADPQAHYHVPLLVSPWSYSTYRGS
ncbi:MAG: hydroxyisourate hydrolase [Phormidesmis sp.]